MTESAEAEQPLLLRRQTCEFVAPDTCFDFQSRVGHPEVGSPGGPAPCVLVLTRSDDREVDDLSLALACRGVPLVRVDSDRCRGTSISWDAQRRSLSVGGATFSPVVTWLRYFSASSLRGLGDGDDLLDNYVKVQWASWMSAAIELSGAFAINGAVGPDVPNRLSQLDTARSAGLRVPHTVVTSDLACAASAIPGQGDLVIKSLGAHCLELAPGRFSGLFPRRLARHEISRSLAVEAAPMMVQEFVDAQRELRIYVVGDEVVAYEVRKPAPDSFWTNPDEIAVERTDIPSCLAKTLLGLARGWGLQVGAFDILDTLTGPVFLEVNAMFDWLVFERPAGCSTVSHLVAKLVCGLFDRGRKAEPGEESLCA